MFPAASRSSALWGSGACSALGPGRGLENAAGMAVRSLPRPLRGPWTDGILDQRCFSTNLRNRIKGNCVNWREDFLGVSPTMKKILVIIAVLVVVAGLVTFMVVKQQSGYTKVMTAKIQKADLATIVSGTGQIKPKTYVNLGATAMGRVTHLFVKEGDHVKKGQEVPTIDNIQQEASVAGQQAAIAAAKTDIASYIAAEKTAQAN